MLAPFKLLSRYSIYTLFFLLPLLLSAEVVRTFQYNKNNQLIQEQKANGNCLTYEYDACGRMIKETASNGTSVQYVYDKNGNCKEMTDPHGTTTYSYDPFNKLIAVKFPSSLSMQYKYNTQGLITEILYPNGWRVSYTYDTSSRLRTVTDFSGITKYEYNDLLNTLIKVTLPNDVYTEYQYDRAKRITDVTHKNSEGIVITSYHYCFDSIGNRTQITEESPLGKRKTECTYDKLNRLLSVERPEGYEKYTYDAIGNRLSKETPAGIIQYEYDHHNRLTKAGNTEFFYDLSGNLIKKISPHETTKFAYDAHDNLTEVRNNSHVVQYSYDGARRRISKNVDGIVTEYINDISAPITQVALSKTISNQTTYTYGLSRLSAATAKEVGFYLYDYPDRNVAALVNSNQKVINKYEYESFGCCQKISTNFLNEFLFAGEAFEEESGLIYLRNRYYDPELGRFISPDPEFGSKTNPQSLNPYAYVNNNPLNYIDPSGLRSAKACAYPAGTKTRDGTSATGHGFWELTYDNGSVETIGRYPGNARSNFDQIYPGTISYEWPATDEQINQIIASVQKGPYLGVSGNCIDGLECGLKVLGVDHPSFSFCGISIPTKAMLWLESLSGRTEFADALERDRRFVIDPDAYMASLALKPEPPVATKASADVGGVSLNKTAKLLGHISEVQGATYDDATGQLIIIGKKNNIKLPKMDFDDLAVAVRSIYGIDGWQQDPGVSLDMDPKHRIDFVKIREKGTPPPPMLVRYEGQTKDTRFGWIMFEADRVLKCLSIGKNNISGKKLHVKVSGYKDLLQRREDDAPSKEHIETRCWFVPKKMSIYKNRKGNALAFKEASMQVLTETKYKKKTKRNAEAEKFAEHITKNFRKYAKEYPILKELERLGKITAVVKWIKDNKIPLDLSLFNEYKPTYHKTPSTTPAVCASLDYENGAILTIVGGVVYHLDESNFHEIVNDDISPISIAALNARPSENVFKWTFRSPLDSMEYEAVAQTIERTAKIGNVKFARCDMKFPTSDEYPLELVRYYNSFNDHNVGLGRGWDLVNTRLRFSRSKMNILWKTDSAIVSVYPEVFLEENGREACYKLLGLNEQHKPIYQSEDKQTVLIETAYGYILQKPKEKQLTFSFDGKIQSQVRNNQTQLTYRYNHDKQLVEVSHANGKKIVITYDHGRIHQAIGPGNKCITYNHNPYEELGSISDSLGIMEIYWYDKDKNLTEIRNCRQEAVFKAVYDDYHRATAKTIHGILLTNSFDLKEHSLQVDKMGQYATSSMYDSQYRLLQASDSAGRLVKMTYENAQTKPGTISDSLGNEKKYTYDRRGNIIKIVDPHGAEVHFWYNELDQLFAYQDPEGKCELYMYNDAGNLTKICHLSQLISENSEIGSVNFSYDLNYITEYGYDDNLDRLVWIKNNNTLIKSFIYNKEGLLETVKNSNGYTVNHTYDERGRLIKIHSPEDGSLQYAYDTRDRITAITGPDSSLTYSYDDIGNLRSIQDAQGRITQYTYNTFGKLTSIQDPQGGKTGYEYDENNNLKQICLPNGTKRELCYDSLNRPNSDIW